MWLKCAPAFLVLWGLWTSTARASLPPDLSMVQMTQLFQDFVLQFKKTYQSQEEMQHRFKIFVQNLESSRELQASELGTAQYGVTQFSDLTESEFVNKFGMTHLSLPNLPPTLRPSDKYLKKKPTFCDWRKAGAVTTVKEQGECGSCWAFSAVSNIEALWNIHKHVARNVSVQDIADIVVSKGPVTALINVKYLQNYQEGVIRNSQACSVTFLNHVVTIVGFGKVKPRRGSQNEPYWILQNSWGEGWGEKGYFRLHRGTNHCGIAMYAATAVVRNSGRRKPLNCPP